MPARQRGPWDSPRGALAPLRSGQVRMAEFRSFKPDAAPEKPDVAGEVGCSPLGSRRKARCPPLPSGRAATAGARPNGDPPALRVPRATQSSAARLAASASTWLAGEGSGAVPLGALAALPALSGSRRAPLPPSAAVARVPRRLAGNAFALRAASTVVAASAGALPARLDPALLSPLVPRPPPSPPPQQRDACQCWHHACQGAQDRNHHLRCGLQGRRRAWRRHPGNRGRGEPGSRCCATAEAMHGPERATIASCRGGAALAVFRPVGGGLEGTRNCQRRASGLVSTSPLGRPPPAAQLAADRG